jgi:hypothetical protein
MIINYLDIKGVTALPLEADTPPLVDTDAVLSFPVSFELLQAACGWDAQVISQMVLYNVMR